MVEKKPPANLHCLEGSKRRDSALRMGLTVVEAKALCLSKGVYNMSRKQWRERTWYKDGTQVTIAEGMMHKEGTSPGKWQQTE